jgi:hypothetical protein
MDIDVKIIHGPIYAPRGKFELYIAWKTTVETGYVVQQIVRDSETHVAGASAPITSGKSYWEAWRIRDGVVLPHFVIPQGIVNDYFNHGERASDTWGRWRIDTDVYYMSDEGFKESEWIKSVKTVGGAGCLYHRDTRPNPDLMSDCILSRYNGGYWNSLAGTVWYHQPGKPAVWPPLPRRPGDPAPPRPARTGLLPQHGLGKT